MSDLAHENMYLVTFLDLTDPLPDLSALTVAQLNAGVHCEGRMTPTGLQRDPSTERKDTSKLNSTFATQSVGRRSYALGITYVREPDDISGLEAAMVYKKPGVVVIRDNKPADGTGWTEADSYEAYPVQCDEPAKSNPAANEDQTIMQGFAMTGDRVDGVVAAAGV